MSPTKRQSRAKRKAKIQRMVRMHAKRGHARDAGQSITRSRFCLEGAR